MTSEDAQRLADIQRKRKDEKRQRETNGRNQRGISEDLAEKRNLKQLRMQLNPTMYIPYDRILEDGGFLGYHMKDKISMRKKEIMDEMSKIMKIEKRFDVSL